MFFVVSFIKKAYRTYIQYVNFLVSFMLQETFFILDAICVKLAGWQGIYEK